MFLILMSYGLKLVVGFDVEMMSVFFRRAVAGAECNTVIELTQEHHIA